MTRFARTYYLTGIIIAVLLACLSAKKVQPEELEFKAQLKECEFISYTESANSIINQANVLVEPTALEKRFLSEYLCQDGNRIGISHTIIRAIRFYTNKDKLPDSGWELLSLYQSSLSTSKGKAHFLSLGRDDQFETARWAVNPVTGKLFDSFSTTLWKPLSISLTRLTGPDSVKNLSKLLPNRPGEPPRLSRGWKVIVYGEMQNTILIDKVIWVQDN